ncbi:outer membrane beta-barrel family protein [Cecembia calidifontis]|nr:outer membrane beta-barrel family protein [Cecembia calidifontis]
MGNFNRKEQLIKLTFSISFIMISFNNGIKFLIKMNTKIIKHASFISVQFICLFLPSYIFGQKIIKGQVLEETDTPLPYALIFFKSGNKILSSTSADSLGLIEMPIKFVNNSYLQASYAGDTSAKVNIDSATYFYRLIINHKQLEEVTVNTSSPFIEKKVDRTVFHIGNRPSFQFKSIIEILNNIPRVTVIQNEIIIRGKGSAQILINDRPVNLRGRDLIDYLRIFQSDISSIEIIPNPPAKYDAEGGGGLINIVLKKSNARGYSGHIQSAILKNTYSQTQNNGVIRIRNKNWGVTIGVNFSTGAYLATEREEIFFLDRPISWLDDANNTIRLRNWLPNIGWEYNISSNSKIVGNYSFQRSNFKTDINQILNYSQLSLIDSIGITTGSERNISQTHLVGLSYEKNLKSANSKFIYSIDFVRRNNDQAAMATTISYFSDKKTPTGNWQGFSTSGISARQIFSNSADWYLSKPNLNLDLELGMKFSSITNTSKIGYDQTENGKSIFGNEIITRNIFNYDELIPAAYFSINHSKGKLASKIGLRYEGTIMISESEDTGEFSQNRFNNIFPSVFFKYNLGSESSIDFSYARRVNRPRIWDINPYRWYQNILMYSVGNPFLIPSIQDNIEFNTTVKNTVFINLFYNNEKNPIITLPFQMDNQVIENRKVNNGLNKNYGVNLDWDWSFVDWLESNFSIGLSGYTFQTNNFNFLTKRRPLVFDFSTIHDFEFSNSFFGSLNFMGTLPGGAFEVLTQNGSFKLDISLKKLFYNNRIELNLNIEDIFRSSQPIYNLITDTFISNSFSYYDFQSILIGVRYRFGNEFRIAGKKNTISNEQMRIR